MSASLPDLFAVLREVIATTWPGHTADRLVIHTRDGRQIDLPIPDGVGPALPAPTPAIPPAATEAALDEPTPGSISGMDRLCQDILLTLEEAGHRLTTTKLMAAMNRGGREWSSRYVSRALKAMIDEGTLVNDQRARPPGYWPADVPHPPE